MFIRIKHIFLIIILTHLTLSCDSNEKNILSKYITDNGYVQFKTTNDLLDNISGLIELSELRKGGYVVIISTDKNSNNLEANKITKRFYSKQSTAIHILNFKFKSDYKKTDKLSIENASLICILVDENTQITKWKHIDEIRESIKLSIKKGGIITGVGDIKQILE